MMMINYIDFNFDMLMIKILIMLIFLFNLTRMTRPKRAFGGVYKSPLEAVFHSYLIRSYQPTIEIPPLW